VLVWCSGVCQRTLQKEGDTCPDLRNVFVAAGEDLRPGARHMRRLFHSGNPLFQEDAIGPS
jgi:hypothetical protein